MDETKNFDEYCGFSQSEIDEEKKCTAELMKRIEKNIVPGCKTAGDEHVMRCKGNNYYSLTSDLYESISTQKDCIKVPYRYEIRDVMEAMMLAYGLRNEEEIRECRLDENMIGIDGEWVVEMAELFRKHWEPIKEFHENAHNRC